MFTQSSLFLLILFILGLLGKNQSILIAVYVLFGIKLFQLEDKVFPYLETKGIGLGVTVLTIAVLVPIATGEIGFKELYASVKSYYAWIALGAGIFVALIAKSGVSLLANDPQLTAALVMGTILAVVFFQGVAVGPLIGAGIAYLVMKLVDFILGLT
ncbi:DUF441 domain-containing protein [Aquibacillus sp. 3ASR75-11]|uniref:UPF0756 membrane protein NC797_05600 n=1 Tax=Terrihalobacillus insolitus TaxID=2950438 RepID=A0A9X3WTJ3_9BACI|nr:DUF441 domain-containing protein [Terrihalobacillus insolitus]MDC3412631.1 DUF441 domain-containing protein [Terrihalobacillus insolitus]MDC3423981.1 DUF441 domain-containing protein [Terrihalobacillus insolitus]